MTKIEDVKKGNYFKVVNSKGVTGATIYVKDSYNKSTKRYDAYKFEDISDFKAFKKGQTVTENFTF